jgi:hypothetical protein
LLVLGCAAASAQIIGLNPTPIAQYYWNTGTNQWTACPNSSAAQPFAFTPQAYAIYGINSGLGRWTPATSCAGSGSSPFQSLTTIGTSGAATLIGGVLNIPNYATGGSPGGSPGAIQWNNSGSFAGAVVSGLVAGNGTSAPALATQSQFNPFLTSPGPIGGTTPNFVGASQFFLNASNTACTQLGGLYSSNSCNAELYNFNSGLYSNGNSSARAFILGASGAGPYNSGQVAGTLNYATEHILNVSGGAIGNNHVVFDHTAATDDHLVYDINSWDNSGVAYPSAQGHQIFYSLSGQSQGYPHLTVATISPSGPAVQTITFSACSGVSNPDQICVPSTNSHLADITQGGPNRFMTAAPVSLTGNCAVSWVSSIATAGGSGSLPTFTACGKNISVSIVPNTTPDAPVSETVTLTSGNGTFTTGLATLVGNEFVEHVLITAVSGSAGTQTVTFNTGRPNTGILLIQGSDATLGGLLSLDAYLSITGYRTSYIYLGSPDGTAAWFTTEAYGAANYANANNGFPFAPASTAGTGDANAGFHTYCAARITKQTLVQSGSFFNLTGTTVEPNACNFTPMTDALEDPDYDAQVHQSLYSIVNQNSNFPAGMSANVLGAEGAGLSGSGSSLLSIGNYNPSSFPYDLTYNGAGGSGKFVPPDGIEMAAPGKANVTAHGLVWSVSPTTALLYSPTANAGQTQLDVARAPWGTFTNLYNSGNPEFYSSVGLEINGVLAVASTASDVATFTINPDGGGDADYAIKSLYSGQALSKMGLCNNNPFVTDTDICLFTGARSSYTVTPNVNLGIAQLNANTVSLTGCASGTYAKADGTGCGTPSGTGVSSFGAGNLSPLFTTSVATATSTPALSFTLSNAAQNSVLAGPASGGAGAPSYQTGPTLANLGLLAGGVLNWNADTGLSRDSADTVDCGNGTQGDKSCTFKAGQIALLAGTNPTQATLTYNTGHAPTGTAGAAVFAPDTTGNLTVNPDNTGFGVLVPLASGFVSGHCGQPTSSGGVWTLVDIGSACGSSGGGDMITSPHSTIAVGGTPTNTTLDLAGGAGQIMAGATPALTSTPTLGASGTLGTLTLGNATSGLLTLAPVTGALGTVTASFPANTGTLAELKRESKPHKRHSSQLE